jgi:hypothetical protein
MGGRRKKKGLRSESGGKVEGKRSERRSKEEGLGGKEGEHGR